MPVIVLLTRANQRKSLMKLSKTSYTDLHLLVGNDGNFVLDDMSLKVGDTSYCQAVTDAVEKGTKALHDDRTGQPWPRLKWMIFWPTHGNRRKWRHQLLIVQVTWILILTAMEQLNRKPSANYFGTKNQLGQLIWTAKSLGALQSLGRQVCGLFQQQGRHFQYWFGWICNDTTDAYGWQVLQASSIGQVKAIQKKARKFINMLMI